MADFESLCETSGIVVRERLGFDDGRRIDDDPNLNASMAVYRLGRGAQDRARTV
jgi:hypothetical protein